MKLDQLGGALWQRVGKPQKSAFFSCIIVGYLVHLYAFTNLIPNADGLSRVYDLQQMTVSGRWFLHYATALNGFTQMPAVIGFLSLVLLGLAAAFAVELLGLRSKVLGALSGAVMAAFPCMGYTFLYMFTASAYCLAIFLAVLSVWLARRSGKLGWLLGVVLLSMVMGTYQVYVTVAIALSVLVVLGEVLSPESEFKPTLFLGLRLMAYLAAGAVLYYVILLVFLKVKNLELLSYLGMDAASAGYPFGQLPRLLVDTYKQVIAFFFLPGSANGFCTGAFLVLNLAALLLGVICALVRMGEKGLWKPLWRPITAIALLCIFPLAINFGQILSPYSVPTPLMKYAYVFVYLAVFLLCDLADGLGKHWGKAAQTEVVLSSVLLLLFCLNTNNVMYTASAQAHRAAESYLTRLMARVESCEGYASGMEIAFVGAVPEGQIRSAVESYAQVDHYSVPLHTVLSLNKHIYYYLNDWLSIPVEEPSEETMISVSDSEVFRAMPLYPAQGSVQVVDGRVVVKLQEQYTPKSDFELAYENRR